MADGLLSLSWNNHKATFCHILSTLRDKERYTDVTLACEGKFYPVHKLVLSTCSEYFESMFEQTPCKHPIIVLKDLKSDEIESLLSYMYAGVVNVAQSDLARLIKAAEMLKVKGLAVPDEPPPQETVSKKSSHPPPWSSRDDRSSPHPKRKRREEPEGESHLSSSPLSSPRASPYHPSNDFHQENTRTPNEPKSSESRERTIDRSEEESRTEQKSDTRLDQHPTNQTSPPQVVLDDTLVKEEIVDPLEDRHDTGTLMNSGMDYGSLTSDSRLENSASEGGGQDHNQLLPNKFEQPIVSAQSQHLPESVVEALAGPSGMQGWLGSGELGGGFSGVESYGDGRHQDMRQSVPGQQPQPHQMMVLGHRGPRAVRGGAMGLMKTPHVSRKLHKCSYCPFTTHCINNYKRHVSAHTGEKPYAAITALTDLIQMI